MQTKGWAKLAFVLIFASFGAYALSALFGVSAALTLAFAEAGIAIFFVFLAPLLFGAGFVLLFLKVAVDRISNTEDDYYSREVEQ